MLPIPAPLKLLRPQQWVKNLFVLAGVFFAGQILHASRLLDALTTFVAFCLASSAVYVLNDLLDREADRLHPRKRNRPLASGTVSTSTAIALGLACAAGALAIAAATSRELLVVLGVYGGINVAYSRWLKHMVLVDAFCVAAGFLLRLLAGTWGIGIPPSKWFVLCTFLLSLFLAFSKRYAERMDETQDASFKRAVVADYTPELLRVLLAVTLACTLMTYGLYTMSPDTIQTHGTTRMVYTLPFAAFVMFRYLFLVMARGYGENLSGEILRDRSLWGAGLAYVLAAGFVLLTTG